jgi:hypothetical protein
VAEGSFTLPAGVAPAGAPARHRLLAYGANRSPEGLGRKLGAPSPPVAAEHGWLNDFDAVYSAHVSPYGAVPAALQHSPGTAVSVHVLHLDDGQLAAIDTAEPNYRLCRLEGIALDLDRGGRLDAVDAYITRHGCLAVEGAERALAAIRARGRRLPALTEAEILAVVRDRLAPGEDVDEFILAGIADPAVQGQRTAALRADALSLRWPSRRALSRSDPPGESPP